MSEHTISKTPASFCTICTVPCAFELCGMLLSLSVFHPNARTYILCDSKTREHIHNLTPQPRLDIVWIIDLDKYTDMSRADMEKGGLWLDFQSSKATVVEYALTHGSPDTMFLDSDIVVTDIIDGIDDSKQLGVSPQFIAQPHVDKTGFFNGGVLWTNTVDVARDWVAFNQTSRYFDQAAVEDLAAKYDNFHFDDNYNLQCWRMYLSTASAGQIAARIKSIPRDKIYYNDKPLKFIHTHFLDSRFVAFNNLLIDHMKNARMYKVLAIVFRVINKHWSIRVPRQPIAGMGAHKNDSYREMPLLMKLHNPDVEVDYVGDTIHCWIAPNIMTYDRPTLEWADKDIHAASLVLIGNGDIRVEGLELARASPVTPIRPWIFWPRKPMLVEQLLKTHPILGYRERDMDSIFIGNIENSVQSQYRNDGVSWDSVLSEYHCTNGQAHKFTHTEYIMKLRSARFGLCLRGYGSKCHREVELMAVGTVPIVTDRVTVESYMEPLVEHLHYIRANTPDELRNKIAACTVADWNRMSVAGHEWYMRNVHSTSAWNSMISHILYDDCPTHPVI